MREQEVWKKRPTREIELCCCYWLRRRKGERESDPGSGVLPHASLGTSALLSQHEPTSRGSLLTYTAQETCCNGVRSTPSLALQLLHQADSVNETQRQVSLSDRQLGNLPEQPTHTLTTVISCARCPSLSQSPCLLILSGTGKVHHLSLCDLQALRFTAAACLALCMA